MAVKQNKGSRGLFLKCKLCTYLFSQSNLKKTNKKKTFLLHIGNITCWFVLLEDQFSQPKTRSKNLRIMVLVPPCVEKKSQKSAFVIFLISGNGKKKKKPLILKSSFLLLSSLPRPDKCHAI